jgi:hypothetical protein
METPKTYWRERYEFFFERSSNKSNEELVAEFNYILDNAKIYSQGVTANIAAVMDLIKHRELDISAIRNGNSLRLCHIRLEGDRIVPRE